MNYREDYYEILEVSPNSSDEIIKAAYRALVKKYHPDVYRGDKQYAEEMMQKINEAYRVLSNPQLHAEYDREHYPEEEEESVSNDDTTENMVTCWNCGNSTPADAAYCTHCGADMRIGPLQPSEQVSAEYQSENNSEFRRRAGKTRRFMFWLPAFILGPFLIYGFFRAFAMKSQQVSQTTYDPPISSSQESSPSSEEDAHITEIKESYLRGYGDSVPIGQAFENFFDEPQWSYERENGADYVVFQGIALNETTNAPAALEIRFHINGTTFQIDSWKNNENQKSLADLPRLLNRIYGKGESQP